MELMEQKVLVNIEDEMRQSYLDYAMSVIVGRALPDVRDGLKPVHRRILYAMNELGLAHNKPYKKSARLVGEVLGKYHPHGDTAVYDSIVRMVQDFSLRYPLIDGQGNFGSVDGDSAAAMRYTESRMAKIAREMLADIDKETVDFGPNFDESLTEPVVLPARIPNLLVNGSSGIAVGMATNIPPHNLPEVVDALVALIDDPAIDIRGLMRHIKGPDFPTAGFIHGYRGIEEAYHTGRGIVHLRARAVIEVNKKGDKEQIVITEIPYQVNKARLVEKIADLVRDKKIEGIADLRDESDREGMRIVVELKRNEISRAILNQLYAHTQMQTSFGIIMLSLVNKQPRILNLKSMLKEFLAFRREVVLRRTRFDLKKAEERAHILEGLRIALDGIDEVIALIKKAKNAETARDGLKKRFGLSDIQAKAVLDMQLHRLTGLEREQLLQELKEVFARIEEYKKILASEKEVFRVIREELLSVREAYGDERRTEIIPEENEISYEDMIIEEDMVITISHTGYIKRNAVSLYRSQRRGGKGVTAMETKEEDFVEQLFIASTHHYLLFFTDRGRVYWLKVHEIPQAGRAARGKAIVNLLMVAPDEKITAVLPVRGFEESKNILMCTAVGIIKKSSLKDYSHPRQGGIIAINLDEGDRLIDVKMTDGSMEVFLATRLGMSIRFPEDQVRVVGRVSRGVKGITLKKGDEVVGMEIPRVGASILTMSEKGYGKRTDAAAYRVQSRGGRGTMNLRIAQKNGPVAGIVQVTEEDEIMTVTQEGMIIRTAAAGISKIGRATQGVKLMDLDEGDRLISIAKLTEKD
jgi:DNA gyrase subunit A